MINDTRSPIVPNDRDADDNQSTAATPGRSAHDERMPRWVVVFVIIGVLIIITFLVVHLAGGGFHGHIPG